MEKLFEEFKNLTKKLEAINTSAEAVIELKKHGNNVAEIAEFIAKRENIPDKTIETLKHAALLHDAGKIMLYPIVRKKETLTTEEKLLMHLHPILSLLIIEIYAEKNNIKPLSKEEVLWILYHHVHPENSLMLTLTFKDKDEIAKILTFADIMSAICEERSYREKQEISVRFIISELEKERNKYGYSKKDFAKFYKYIPDIFKIIKTKGDDKMNNNFNNDFNNNLTNTKEYDTLLEKAEKIIKKTFEKANNEIEKEIEKSI